MVFPIAEQHDCGDRGERKRGNDIVKHAGDRFDRRKRAFLNEQNARVIVNRQPPVVQRVHFADARGRARKGPDERPIETGPLRFRQHEIIKEAQGDLKKSVAKSEQRKNRPNLFVAPDAAKSIAQTGMHRLGKHQQELAANRASEKKPKAIRQDRGHQISFVDSMCVTFCGVRKTGPPSIDAPTKISAYFSESSTVFKISSAFAAGTNMPLLCTKMICGMCL